MPIRNSLRKLRKYAKDNIRRDVRLEHQFRLLLKQHHLQHERQTVVGYYIVDFLLKRRRLIVEIYETHHQDQVEYDERREKYLKERGFHVLIVREGEDFEEAIQYILTYYPDSYVNLQLSNDILKKANDRKKHIPSPRRRRLHHIELHRDKWALVRKRLVYGYFTKAPSPWRLYAQQGRAWCLRLSRRLIPGP